MTDPKRNAGDFIAEIEQTLDASVSEQVTHERGGTVTKFRIIVDLFSLRAEKEVQAIAEHYAADSVDHDGIVGEVEVTWNAHA